MTLCATRSLKTTILLAGMASSYAIALPSMVIPHPKPTATKLNDMLVNQERGWSTLRKTFKTSSRKWSIKRAERGVDSSSFSGLWQLDQKRTDNPEEMLKAQGVPWVARKR